MDAAGLMDLGYSGCPYTWKNAREGAKLIMERLDKALANPPLLDAFPHIKVHHLTRIHSDHCPIIVSLDNPILKGPFPFRCKEVWMEHPNFKNFFTSNWLSVNTDFLIGKKRLLARINGIQIALAKNYSTFLVNLEASLIKDLTDIFNKERQIWAQKTGINWRKFGDYSTKYFHVLAKIKKSRGKVLTLKNDHGDWVTDPDTLKNMAANFYSNMFRTTHDCSNFGAVLPTSKVLSIEDISDLGRPVTKEEIKFNLSCMDQ
ncbi:uncharacterized protein [Spinacia oleracea]|uniref:RNA-directed DNA polymerase (Reverse transcriptase) n=1 Tax=Spinacia oleracea TaxID=3562 RepID=A0ABM3QJC8_SPIOL|nr:uncharacterized protein LOC130459872 [Spinacia oleracea]